MKKSILTIFLGLVIFSMDIKPALASNEAGSSAGLLAVKKASSKDLRTEKLKDFLSSFESPLASYSAVLVKTADKYKLDWKLIPAITGVESTFGKAIPSGSYNAYGWANGAYYFESWENSIEIVAKTLKENYINRGADTVEKIAPIYAPPSTTWAGKVSYFMEKLENFGAPKTIALELSL